MEGNRIGNRLLGQEHDDDIKCRCCGWWFEKDNTRHYCPMLSNEIELKPEPEIKELKEHIKKLTFPTKY